MTHRSPNDWAALRKAEFEVYHRLRGLPVAESSKAPGPAPDDIQKLADVAKAIAAPAEAQKVLRELKAKAEEVRKALAELDRKAAFEQYKQQEMAKLETERQRHADNAQKEYDLKRSEIEAQQASWKARMAEFLAVAEGNAA